MAIIVPDGAKNAISAPALPFCRFGNKFELTGKHPLQIIG